MWFILSAITGILFGLQSILTKYLYRENFNQKSVFFLYFVVAAAIFPFYMLFAHPAPPKPYFYYALPLSFLLNLVAISSFLRALQEEDLSIVMPLVSLSPLFILLTSLVLLGEKPDRSGLLGIIAITAGTYTISAQRGQYALLSPIKTLLSSRGARYALLTAFLWSITSNFDKIGIINSSPITYSLSISVLFTVFLLLFHRRQLRIRFSALSIGFAVLQAIMLIAQFIAVKFTLVSYVIAFKRAGLLLSVLYGGMIFKEKNFAQRLFGSILIVFGIFLIVL